MVKTKQDFIAYFNELLVATNQYQMVGNGRMDFGSSGTHYDENQIQIEGFMRLLWGVGPAYKAGVISDEQFQFYRDGILNGVNPSSRFYWGVVHDYDQLIVEMASLVCLLIETKPKFWDKLNRLQQQHLYNWLNQVNNIKVYENNWLFFRILVNLFFSIAKLPINQENLKNDISLINRMYIGDGWYTDGVGGLVDYYESWALQFYGLFFSKYGRNLDSGFCDQAIERATKFAKNYQYWFDDNGTAVAYGRSLTYRFAQIAFWSMLVYCDMEVISWGQMKQLIYGNLTNWQNQKITKRDGILSIGYGYENLIMSESYNGPGSPYWGFKCFILLAINDEHPFWSASSTLTQLKPKIVLEKPKMILTNVQGKNVMMYPSNQHSTHLHGTEKYAKFVYSTDFGFSVTKGNANFVEGAFDNVLAVAEEDTYHYQTKEKANLLLFSDDRIVCRWDPLPHIQIISMIIPLGSWHVRIYKISANRNIKLIDSGFCIQTSNSHDSDQVKYQNQTTDTIWMDLNQKVVASKNLVGYEKLAVNYPEPNTNLLFTNTALTNVRTTALAGETLLASAHFGGANRDFKDSDSVLLPYSELSKIQEEMRAFTFEL